MSSKMNIIERLGYQLKKITRPSTVEFDGVRVRVFSDLPKGIKRALYRGDYEFEERSLVKTTLKSEDRVLEIGTGIGVVASLCARLVPDGELLCYEANPALVAKIEENFELNNVKAELRNRAVSAENGTVEFYFNDNIVSSSIVDRGNSIEPTVVECDDLKSLVKTYKPTAIVMDIEGAEVDVFDGVDLSGVRIVIIETHPWIVGQEAIDGLLGALNQSGLKAVAGKSFNDTVVLERNDP